MNVKRIAIPVVLLALLLLPAAAWAQSGFTGVVRDTSGGVLPGVTVEARSPALIEGVQTAVTDGAGVYQIINLRPGTYSVTFTLPGFNTFRSEGITLQANFTATVNADLALGNLEETVTVTGEAPVVDIRNTRTQVQLTTETMEALPGSGRLSTIQTFLPGATLRRAEDRAVGGLNDRAQQNFRIHGGPDAQAVVDGVNLTMSALTQGVLVYNQIAIQEVVVDTSGAGADRDSGGMQLNMIPKDGGNQFTGAAQYSFSNSSLESSNINDDLVARNLSTDRLGSLKKYRDDAFAIGGPIQQDKVWFFAAFREGVTQFYPTNRYFNANKQPAYVPGGPLLRPVTADTSYLFAPDLAKPAFTDEFARDVTIRVTAQVAQKHKLNYSILHQPNCNCVYNLLQAVPVLSPEATGEHRYNPNYVQNGAWTYPASNRLLFEAGAIQNSHAQNDTTLTGLPYGLPDVPLTDIRIEDQGLNMIYGSVPSRTLPRKQWQERFSMSYVTGSHNFKAGTILRQTRIGDIDRFGHDLFMNGTGVQYRLNAAHVPNRITLLDGPWNFEEHMRDIAVFAQDQWTVSRFTVNAGVRFNNEKGSHPKQVLGAGFWVPERVFEATGNTSNRNNFSPRLGLAYDVFGDGRTAIKGQLGYYPDPLIRTLSNPAVNLTRTTNINWTDRNGNFIPDCDLLNPTANGECGAWQSASFGQPRAEAENGPDTISGWNNAPANWQASIAVQHELAPGVALTAGYYRTWYPNLLTTQNTALTTANFDEFCVQAPSDSRLGSVSGQQLCGFYDIKGVNVADPVANVIDLSRNFGGQDQIYNGVDVTLNARFGQGGTIQGGLSTAQESTNQCASATDPTLVAQNGIAFNARVRQSADFCNNAPAWSALTQVKFLAIYPIAYGVQASIIYADAPGIPVAASLVVPNSQVIWPNGSRDLGACGVRACTNQNVTVDLIQPFTVFEKRSRTTDLRFSKNFNFGGARVLHANLDLHNLFNAADVLRMQTAYGSTWQNVDQILSGRLIRVGVQIDF